MAVEPDLSSEIYREFDVRVVENEERYFCLLSPCVDKNKSLSNRQHWITHRKFVHKEKDNVNLPSGRVIRKWLTERAGYQQPLGRVERRMVAAPTSLEEGNMKTYSLVVHISGLMAQLGSAWQELARAVQDRNHSLPQSALPRIVAEKVKEMYLNLERGTAIGGDLSRKPDESKGRKRRRARDEQDVEGDQREWGPMNKAMADEAGMHFPKLLKPLDVREGQQMYHAPHDHERAMEERGVEDGREMHAMGARVSDHVGWSLAALARPDGSVMADHGDGGMHVEKSDVVSRIEDLVPVVGIGVG